MSNIWLVLFFDRFFKFTLTVVHFCKFFLNTKLREIGFTKKNRVRVTFVTYNQIIRLVTKCFLLLACSFFTSIYRYFFQFRCVFCRFVRTRQTCGRCGRETSSVPTCYKVHVIFIFMTIVCILYKLSFSGDIFYC